MSMIGGFPIGAKMISDCVKDNKLTKNQGKRMLLFCVNPGPAFVINIVGVFMLKSYKAGAVLLVSLCVSSFVTGIVSRIFKKEEPELTNRSSPTPKQGVLYESVNDSVKSIISICGWIVVFCAIQFIVNASPISEHTKQWLNIVCEVTSGCDISTKSFPLSVTAFVLGWAGLSVHAQIMQYIETVGLKYKYFVVSRVINGSLSFAFSYILFKLFPCEVSAFSNLGEIIPQAVSVSVPAAIAMMFLFVLVILDLAPGKKV